MTKKDDKPVVRKIVEGALVDNRVTPNGIWFQRNWDDKSVTEITQKPFAAAYCYSYIVNIYDEPVSAESFHSFDPNVIMTRGLYTISYLPKSSPRRRPNFPYLIGQDLIRWRLIVSGPAHWKKVCERVPELAWLDRNTDVEKLFRYAKMHPGLPIRFGINFDKYCRKIEQRAEELGIDIDHKPLVSYVWGDSMKEYADKEFAIIRSKKDYEQEWNETQQDETVQTEIKGVK